MAKQIKVIAIGAIILSWLAVLSVGLLTLTPMIGDEVTHYYMLVTQSERLPAPCFEAQIPLGLNGADKETRFYPHVAMWHYLGAVLLRVTGSIAVVQIYHSLFLLQLLLIVLAMVGKLGGGKDESRLLAMIGVASLPMTLIFSVAFYQDVPATAQVMTAFWLLMSGRWLLAAVFISLALGIKENMMLFLPAYFINMVIVTWKDVIWRKLLAGAVALAIILVSCWFSAYVLQKYVNGNYYPYEVLKTTVNKIRVKFSQFSDASSIPSPVAKESRPVAALVTTLYAPNVIANHPGDLRISKNWFVYGGGVIWLLLLAGAAGFFVQKKENEEARIAVGEGSMMLFAGFSYIILTSLFLEAPDARFFMPGIIFLSIPAAVYAVRIPKVTLWIWIFVLAAFFQGGAVLRKTYSLRHVSAGIMEAVDYLRSQAPSPNRIFMYPEGNYRLFPCNHEWYLDYKLRDFWKANNNSRLDILHAHKIGAVVIKKHLVGVIDPQMNNLGIYPDYFVRDLDADCRFSKVFDNKDIIIYKVPAADR